MLHLPWILVDLLLNQLGQLWRSALQQITDWSDCEIQFLRPNATSPARSHTANKHDLLSCGLAPASVLSKPKAVPWPLQVYWVPFTQVIPGPTGWLIVAPMLEESITAITPFKSGLQCNNKHHFRATLYSIFWCREHHTFWINRTGINRTLLMSSERQQDFSEQHRIVWKVLSWTM